MIFKNQTSQDMIFSYRAFNCLDADQAPVRAIKNRKDSEFHAGYSVVNCPVKLLRARYNEECSCEYLLSNTVFFFRCSCREIPKGTTSTIIHSHLTYTSLYIQWRLWKVKKMFPGFYNSFTPLVLISTSQIFSSVQEFSERLSNIR